MTDDAEADRPRPLSTLTRDEWRLYEWIDVTRTGDLEPMMRRGPVRTSPPEFYPPFLKPDA